MRKTRAARAWYWLAGLCGMVVAGDAAATLAAAVLPTSRSMQVGEEVTVFATLINAGDARRSGCGIRLADAPEGVTFSYFLANPNNTIVDGSEGAEVELPAGGLQRFVMVFASQAAFEPMDFFPEFACSDGATVAAIPGINSVTLSASAEPTLDIIAIAATPSADGILHGVPGDFLPFALATFNAGSAGRVRVAARGIGAASTLDISLCQSDPFTAECFASEIPDPTGYVTDLEADAISTWSVFLPVDEVVALQPDVTRIFVEFFDEDDVLRGATSVALSIVDPDPDFVAGVFEPAEQFANRCVAPRSGVIPFIGGTYADVPGTALDERNFLRSWSLDTYLWYDEIDDVDPLLVQGTLEYFNMLRTYETLENNQPKDQFHFTQPFEMFLEDNFGIATGYGWEVVLLSEAPIQISVAMVEPDSPAGRAGVTRGASIVSVDGIVLQNINPFRHDGEEQINAVNEAIYFLEDGETHTFVLREPGMTATHTVTLTTEATDIDPVPVVTTFEHSPAGAAAPTRFGYFNFNDHDLVAEQRLIDAVNELAAADIDELVIDLRYNGGGFIDVANRLAAMVAGNDAAGEVFVELRFNDKHRHVDPISGETLRPRRFITTASSDGRPLPTLDLDRVFVITSASTCSASEEFINALRGIDFPIVQIGGRTCGKPYGFYPQPNCGTVYYTIQFQGLNAKGFGDFDSGFSVADDPGLAGVQVPGCYAVDDLDNALGDPGEGMLATLLHYAEHGQCPLGEDLLPSGQAALPRAVPKLVRPIWQEAAIMGRPSMSPP